MEITREIAIDAAHRVPQHHSKCRNLHGHRYVIQATCEGELATHGSEEGMVLDFGFLKEEMVDYIDRICDHGLILWKGDPLLRLLVRAEGVGKLVMLDFIPTAENLAKWWFDQLKPRIEARSQGRAHLVRVRVYETPNCWADFTRGKTDDR